MDVLRPVRAFDRVQQRHAWLGLPMAVVKKFSDDGAGGLAALIAYYAFFSLFPLLLVFVTILGFVFQGNPGAQHTIRSSVLGHFPIIGNDLSSHALTGRASAIVIGTVFSLWAGLGVTQAAQNAFDTVWAVPRKDRPDFLHKRLRGLVLLLVLGGLFVISTGASGLVAGGLGGPALKVAGIVLSLLLNFALYAAAFRLLTTASVPARCLWVGVVVGGVAWEILQVLGGIYVHHVVSHASNTYGTFAAVIGLLAWLHLGAQVTLYSAELNVVLMRRLWPRSLLGPPAAPADEATLKSLAKVEERYDHEQVEVEFRTDGPAAPAPEPEPRDPS